MPEPSPSSVEELAGLVIELRMANAGLREVISAQAERIAVQEAALAAQVLTASLREEDRDTAG